MDITTTINLLKNSGIEVIRYDSNFIYFQDPSCILPAFDTFLHYAWIIVMGFTAVLLFGWAILYIKNGVKINELFDNAKTLILILCIMSLAKPIVGMIYGENLFARGCETKQVSIESVQELLDMRHQNLNKSAQDELYESFDVIDTGPIYPEY